MERPRPSRELRAIEADPQPEPREIRAALTARLLTDSGTAEIAHVVLGLTVSALLVGIYPVSGLTLWFASLVVASAIRYRVRKGVATWSPMPVTPPRRVYAGITLVGIVWAVGAVPLVQSGGDALHHVMVVECGLAAAATATFVADVLAFQVFVASIFLPLVIGILSKGVNRASLTSALLVVVFWAVMSALQRRGHGANLRAMNLQRELELSRTAAERGRAEAEAAEDGMRESEERLFQLVDSMPVGVIVVNDRGRLYYGNAAARAIGGEGLRGGAPADDVGNIFPVFIPGTNTAYPRERLPAARALKGERIVDQFEVLQPGGRRLIEVRGSPIRDRAGNVQYGVAVLSDLSDRQIGSDRRAALTAVLQLAADATSESQLLADVLALLNDRFGFSLSEMWTADDDAGVMRRVGSARRGTDQLITEFDRVSGAMTFATGAGLAGGVWASGEPIWWNRSQADMAVFARRGGASHAGLQTALAVPVFVAGMASGVLVSFAKDAREQDGAFTDLLMAIGAQVGGAIGRRRAEAGLRAAEDRYRQLVEASTDLVWELDLEGRWKFVNDASRRIYGLAPSELVGTLATDRSDSDHLATDLDILGRLREGAVIHEYETVHRSASGARVPISTSAAPIRDSSGEITGFHGIIHDMGTQAAAREALRAARDAAQQAAAAKTAFLANMSHEIRTPMNGVLGVTELLLDTNLDAEQRRAVELIATSGRSLMEVINEILDFSKIEANQLEIESLEFDLHELIDSTVKITAAGINGSSVEIITDIRDDVPVHVLGDSTRLRQVMTNLIGNAVKFTSSGEIVVSVERMAGTEVPRIEFSVRDTGIGMTPATTVAIFEPFRQADSSTTRRYGGTGLGLSISRRLVELMGGTLGVTSEAGVGSRFSFMLVLPETAEPVRATDATVAGVRVLVVDDNPTNRRVMSAMLTAAGCLVQVESGGAGALVELRRARAADTPYGVIVSDVQMPDMDGFELLRLIRGDDLIRGTPAVLATSGSRRGDLARSDSFGVAAYLLKPVSRRELKRAVHSAVSGGTDEQPTSIAAMRVTERPLRVLIAEDNSVNQEVARAMLQRRGHAVTVVGNGVDAVTAALASNFDVILMDIQMPEMDGLTATREIRQRRAAPRSRIVALTANVLPDERAECIEAGMDGYLAKPFVARDLFAVVEHETARPVAGVTSSATEDAPVDLEALRSDLREAGIEESMAVLVRLFLRDGPERLSVITAAAEANDAPAMARAAHALKSAAGTVRAGRLAALLGTMENAAKAGDAAGARAIVPSLTAEHDSVRRWLESPERH